MEHDFFRMPFTIGILKGIPYKRFNDIYSEKLNDSLNSQTPWYRSKMAQLANKNWNIRRSVVKKYHEGFQRSNLLVLKKREETTLLLLPLEAHFTACYKKKTTT
jgi:hypothetical protein